MKEYIMIKEIGNAPITVAELVRCRDCKHRPTKPEKCNGIRTNYNFNGFDLEFPDDKCPCYCGDDEYYSWYPSDDWFCPVGERRSDNA